MHTLAALIFVAALAAQTAPKVTTPKEALGFNLGDDYQVANYTQLEAYWKKLASESDRMKLVDIGPTAEGRRQYMAIITSPENMKQPRSLQGHLAPAGAGRGAHGRPGPRAGPRGQSGGVDRWRAARQRDGGLAAAHGDGLPDGEPHRSGNHAFSERRDPAVRAGQPGRPGAGRQLVHARIGETGRAAEGPAQAHHERPAAALRQVHRPRRQPRLLHVQHAGDHQHEPPAFPGVVSADHVQPPPDRTRRRGDFHAAVPRSVQLQLRSADSAGNRAGGHRHAQPAGGGRQGRQRHAQRRQLLHLVERRPAHHHLLPQHDRHPHRDHRQSHAHDHPGGARRSSCRKGDWPMPVVPATVALPAIHRVRDHQQPGHPRPGVALSRDLPVQHLAHGNEFDREGQQGLLDGHAQAHCRRWKRRRGGGSERPHGSHGALQHRPARSQNARSARLHHSVGPGGFRHRHRVRQRSAQDRHHGPAEPLPRFKWPARATRPARTW